MGAWDDDAAERAAPPSDEELLGHWALRVGATDARALSHALRKQVQRRIGWLFGLDPPELRLTNGRLDPDMEPLEEPPTTSELIVSALRDRVASEPLFTVRRRLGEGLFVLTPLGRELLQDAVLWPEEQAMVPLLEAGAPIDALLAACRHSPRAQRTLYALRIVGACGPPEPREGYAVLLRKTRQMRRAAEAAELLDLPAYAGGDQARRALRRLARTVHPDRFGAAAPLAIRDASARVMTALNRASRDMH
jgi:hypothetical protein